MQVVFTGNNTARSTVAPGNFHCPKICGRWRSQWLKSTVRNTGQTSTNCYWKQLDTIILNIDMWKQNEHTKKWTAAKITMLRVRPNEGITTHTHRYISPYLFTIPGPCSQINILNIYNRMNALWMQAFIITLNKSHTSKISYKLLFFCETDVTWCHS